MRVDADSIPKAALKAPSSGAETPQESWDKKKFRIIILGAGFSRPANFPLALELWEKILSHAPTLEGRAAKFNDDLESYIEYLSACEGRKVHQNEINFEDFMKFLDIEHFLGLRGSDTWSREGNEGTIVAKTLIGQILANSHESLGQIPNLYLEFARRLEPSDIVMTFNYDTLLEDALDAVKKPYRLFTTRFRSVGEHSGIVDNDRDEVIVLKMHGSIDWFDKQSFEHREKINRSLGAPPPEDIIFSHERALQIAPLVDGPRFDQDPLRTICRVRNLKALYDKSLMFLATPRMLSPSSAKIMYARQFSDFWDGMGAAGALNFGMAIVGFSLPVQDE